MMLPFPEPQTLEPATCCDTDGLEEFLVQDISTLDDMAVAGNTLCDGLDMVLNTTAGWPVPLLTMRSP